jgi:hypothetical protein
LGLYVVVRNVINPKFKDSSIVYHEVTANNFTVEIVHCKFALSGGAQIFALLGPSIPENVVLFHFGTLDGRPLQVNFLSGCNWTAQTDYRTKHRGWRFLEGKSYWFRK